jgi:hypothetical protein
MGRDEHFARRTRRPDHRRPVRRRILVLTQGKVTEPAYFDRLRQMYRQVVVVVKDCPKSPLQMLDVAIAEQAKAAKNREDRFDSVWVVFDAEERPDEAMLRALRQKAGQHEIRLAWSNPCFEIWLLLHLAFSQAPIFNADQAIRQLVTSLPSYAKDQRAAERSMAVLIPKVAMALTHAQRLRDGHATRGAGEFPNPATDVDLLVREIIQAVDGHS